MSTAQSTAVVTRIPTGRTEAGGTLAGWGTCLQILADSAGAHQ